MSAQGDDSTVTNHFLVTHTMLRIKDPALSLPFYQRALGMELVKKVDYPQWKFTVFFLAPKQVAQARPLDAAASSEWLFTQSGIIELTHNWPVPGVEPVEVNGGSVPGQGYGHMCIAVPDIERACAHFEELSVVFTKRLGEGGMKNIAFIQDPDGYRFEVVQVSHAPGLLREIV